MKDVIHKAPTSNMIYIRFCLSLCYGDDFQNFGMKFKVRYTFLKNWYKVGYTFGKTDLSRVRFIENLV